MFQRNMETAIAAAIALILTLAVVAIVIFQVQQGRTVDVPEVLSSPFLLIVGYFYGQHASTNGARQAGTAAAQTAVEKIQNTTPAPPSA